MMKHLWALTACVALMLSFTIRAAERPNIIFLLADDMGSHDVGWRGSEIRTPHLDKLCAQGAKLEQFYVQPVCSPTRASLMTGRYPMRYGMQVGVIRPWAEYGLALEERMLPQALREAGYTTVMCGKWHLGSFDKAYWPNARGFDHFYGHLTGALDYFSHERDGKLDWYRNGKLIKEEGYATYLIANEAAKMIREQPKGKPLFLYVPFNAVHAPFQVPEKYKEPYGQFKGQRRTYAGMVTAMDEAVGQIVAAVDQAGQRKNTIFIFASDNGGPAPKRISSNGPLRAGKNTLYEGGVRTCAFVTWEGRVEPGTTVNALSHMVDWYPTILKLAGASLEQKLPMDGRDIWPCITAGKSSPHEELLVNAAPHAGAIRVGDWKLVINGRKRDLDEDTEGGEKEQKEAGKDATEQIELFNLGEDRGEQKNLAESNPQKVKELRRRYEAYAARAVRPKNAGQARQ
jgi:arylsulfatase A-like enzyme